MVMNIFLLILIVFAVYVYWLNFSLKRSLSILKERQDAEDSFLAGVVHDLKTPTNSQLSALKMLENGYFGRLSDEQEEIVELMFGSCKYMSNLIETILNAHNNFGCIKLNKSEFDMSELLVEVCEETKGLSTERKQKIILHVPEDDLRVYADKFQIKRVVFNLLSNAITYGFCGSVIEITLKFQGRSFEFFVENMSKQIPKEELCVIFEKYTRTGYSYLNNLGTGLGLYLVKQIINLHNGRVYAKSAPNGKCTFGFVIPNYVSENKKCRPLLKKSAFL